MPDPLLLKAVARAMVLPPTGPLLLALFGLFLWRRHARTGRALAAAGVVSLLILSMPAVAALLLRTLDTASPFDLTDAKGAQAIVILGGGVRNAPEYGGETLGRLTLERVRYGARVARATSLPVLVTGGLGHPAGNEAALMRDALQGEFGVPVRWVEDRSHTTRENAQFTAAILGREKIHRVLLVGHSMDMPRALAEFTAVGIEPLAAPTGLPTSEIHSPLDFVPSLAGLSDSYYALYEWLALLVQAISPPQ
jgi:uncharacterized SAM-binding protein YcdF (DUF218 family)